MFLGKVKSIAAHPQKGTCPHRPHILKTFVKISTECPHYAMTSPLLIKTDSFSGKKEAYIHIYMHLVPLQHDTT